MFNFVISCVWYSKNCEEGVKVLPISNCLELDSEAATRDVL